MLPILAGILLIVWAIGMLSGNTFGGLLHVFLAVAAVIFIIRMGRGTSPLRRG